MNWNRELPIFGNRIILFSLVLFCLFHAESVIGQTTPTPGSMNEYQMSGYAKNMLEAINLLREENGLSQLIPDAALSAAAEDQAAYLLKIGQITERGQNQESPKTKANDFGYAGGADFYINQNIATSWVATQAKTVLDTVWMQEPVYKVRILNPDATHIGIGAVDNNSRRYIVVYTGWLADGSIYYTAVPTYDWRTPKPEASYTPSPKPLQISTSNPDGSIQHRIQKGETLSEIAYAYGVNWDTLSNLNNLELEDPVIIEGQDLLIRSKFTVTPTPTASETPRPPTRTPRPTYTKSSSESSETQILPSTTPTDPVIVDVGLFLENSKPFRKPVGILLVIVSGVGLLLSFRFKKNNHKGK